jgi:hypothetical protein
MSRIEAPPAADLALGEQLALGRDGYWFDEEAPIASAPTGRVLVAARAPRSRSARRRSSSARGDPDPSDEPDLAVIPISAFRAELDRVLEGVE